MHKIPGNVFPRVLDHKLPLAQKASGCWIEDSDGNRYLDASGGAIVVNIGQGREEIAKAVHDQILDYHYVHPTMMSSPVVEALANALAHHAPQGVDRFYFLSSGSEAVEAAIKLARQIHLANDRPHRFRLIARWKSYHGLTLGALSAMGRTAFRVPYAPMLSDAVHIPPPYCLRCAYGLKYPSCDIRCALALEDTIENVGPDTITAFLGETVSGGTLAAYPPPDEYWPIIRRICDHYDILLILDEVMCGMGRTGSWFACQQYNVIPDLMTLGKGLSGGSLPLSAVGVRSRHFDSLCRHQGGFMHGGTFTHHPVTAAAGMATVRILEQEKLVERVARMENTLGERLKDRLAGHPHVADVRGIGFLWGVELVRDKVTNAPFDRSEQIAEKVWEAAYKRGVIVYKATGLAGTHGDAFLVAPPFVIESHEIELAADTIRKALHEVFK